MIREWKKDGVSREPVIGLSNADLRNANLKGLDLRGANLNRADLKGVDLRETDLSGANLSEADLRGADMGLYDETQKKADLIGADLSGADLRDVKGVETEKLKQQARSVVDATYWVASLWHRFSLQISIF
jgi:hypothetical protein